MYDDLFAQLAAHRFTLAQQREQRAKFGAGMVPPQIDHTIAEACAAIDQLKAQLRAAGVDVDDAPGDTQSQLSDIAGQYDAAEALLATLPEDEFLRLPRCLCRTACHWYVTPCLSGATTSLKR